MNRVAETMNRRSPINAGGPDTAPERDGVEARGRMPGIFVVWLTVFLCFPVASGFAQVLDPLQLGLVPIGKPVPKFDLPPVKGRTLGFSDNDLKGEVSLVNVFASWCTACLEEHPLLMKLARENVVPIHGLNYKDKPDDAERWLDRLGDPYTRTGADRDGRVAIDWGVYGVPETFVVDRQGRIAHKHIGTLTKKTLDNEILPIIYGLRK